MSNKPTKTRATAKQSKTARTAEPRPSLSKTAKIYVLFGVDENGKPRAARFTDANEDLVARAAQAMGLRIGVTTGTAHTDVVGELPLGKLYAPGKGLVPNIPQELYDKLNALAGGDPGPMTPTLPTSWTELKPGHLVIAQDTVDAGWWEAIVVKREGDMLTLRWRDYPQQDMAVRHVKAVALLNSEKP